MNDAIQRQLEGRLERYTKLDDEDLVTTHDLLARECAALRQLCAEALKALEWSTQRADQVEGLRDELQAAAEGRQVT